MFVISVFNPTFVRCYKLNYHTQFDYLLFIFSDQSEIFDRLARLQKEPFLEDFAELLALVASAKLLQEPDILADALKIYAKIGHSVNMQYDQSKSYLIRLYYC